MNDNCSTPLQGQQDEQPEHVNIPGNAIDDDVVNIMTLYPPWSLDTNDGCDINQIANDRCRKVIQDELYKDTPVKTEINKPDSIDLTESPLKHTSTQRHIEKINEDTSDNDTDEMITFDEEKVKKTCRKDIDELRKRAKTVKTKKDIMTKMYTINIERKKLLKQRRKKALQNAKDRKLAKENFLTALKANCKADRASNDTQSSTNTNDELINGVNADTIIHVDNIDNIEIVAENATNMATNAENIDTDSIKAGNIVNAEIENEKSEEVVMSDDNTDNTAMSDNNIDDTALGNDNIENVTPGETSTEDVPLPLLYGKKTTDPSKVKTSKKHIPIQVRSSEPSIVDPPTDEITTEMAKGHTFDPTEVRVYEFFIQGTPNPKDLEGVEEDQLLEIQ